MARKRPLKRRKESRQQQQQQQPQTCSTMSSEEQSGRHSSDGAFSERAISDGNRTAMTSIEDFDEEMSERRQSTLRLDESDDDDEEEGGKDDDSRSVVQPHMRRQASSPARTEMVFISTDSQMVNSDMGASTRSLWEQDLDYRQIHGRRYCGDYFMPNDELEQLRLSLLHQVFLHVMDGELTVAPLDNPSHILDVGTGTGDWAIRMAEIYPKCEVVGTDISAIAETKSVPMNVFFEIEDAEDWDRAPGLYDLIHFRLAEGIFRDWNDVYDNVFYSLKPGGWIEIQDFDTREGVGRFVDQFSPDSPMHTLIRDLHIASEKSGRDRGIAHMKQQVLEAAGFENVVIKEHVIPISVAEQTAGKIWLIACLDSIEAHCLRPLTETMGWDAEVCKAACESAAREMAELSKDPAKSQGLQITLYNVTARKPLSATSTGSGRRFQERTPEATMAPEPDEISIAPETAGEDEVAASTTDQASSSSPPKPATEGGVYGSASTT